MMLQSSALRRLEEILTEAVANGDRNEASGPLLLKTMKLSGDSQNIVDFYELLNKAKEEARSIKNKPKIDRYVNSIEKLHQIFIVNHIWGAHWQIFATYIEDRDVLNVLDSLADFFYSQNPAMFLDKDFLSELNSEFASLLGKILKSDLSKELKKFLIVHLDNILKAIRRYYIDGTEGLEKATKSLVSDLVITEHRLQDVDKKNPIYKHVQAWALSLLLYIAPSPYDIIGAVPDIHDFWVPQYKELAEGHKKIEKIICKSPTLQKAVEKSSNTFDRQPQRSIEGSKELKALPAPKEDLGAAAD
jgi:hypothetical protein